MSNLSELLPAGGAGKNVSFVASGTLPNGQAVALKSDGTVEAVTQTSTAKTRSIPASSETVFSGSNGTTFTSIDFNPYTAGQFIISYQDITNSGYGTAVVGNVSGTTITFQTPVLWQSGAVSRNEIAFDPKTVGKFVIAFKSTANSTASAVVGTISGNSLSFGTVVIIESGGSEAILAFDPHTAGRCAVGWVTSSVNHGKVAVGTVSGTSISFGTSVVYNAAQSGNAQIKFDSLTANRLAVAYYDGGNSSSGTAIIGTLSGTNISFGSEFVFNSGATYFPAIAFSPHQANTFVVAYRDGSDSNRGNARPATVTGTSISYGTEQLFNATGDTNSIHVAFCHHTPHKFIIAYQDELNSNYGTLIEGTLVPGVDTITFGTEVVFNAAQTGRIGLAFDPSLSNAGMFIISYQDTGNSYYGTAILGQIATTAATNVSSFIGMADAAIADTAAGSVTIKGGLAKSISNVAIDVPGTVPDGNAVYFSTGRGRYSNVQWDPSDSTKFVVAWTDGSTTPTYQGYAAVGSVSGNTITYGTPVQFDSLMVSDMDTNSIAFDPNQSGRFVIFYSGGGGQGSRAIAGTRSGTNLSFGTSVQVFNNPAVQPSIEFDPNTSGQFLMNWGDGANNLRVGTLSGTTITLGTLVSISASYNQPNLVADPNNAGKYLIVYQDGADSDHGYVAVVTVTGTTPSMATPVKFLSAACVQPKIVYDSGVADAFVMVFVDGGNSSQARAIAGVVSGTTVSFGTAITFNSNANNQLTTIISADPNKTGSFIAVADVNTIGEATFLTRSGTNTITAGATHTLYNAAKLKGAIAFNPSASKSGQFVYVTEDRSASPYKSISVLGQGGYTTSVIVPGTDYYVQADGTISTTSTSPAVKLGKALSTTSINLEFNT
jgi:hypothetical protein